MYLPLHSTTAMDYKITITTTLRFHRNTEIQKREELTLKYKETLAKIEDKYSIKKEEQASGSYTTEEQ